MVVHLDKPRSILLRPRFLWPPDDSADVSEDSSSLEEVSGNYFCGRYSVSPDERLLYLYCI